MANPWRISYGYIILIELITHSIRYKHVPSATQKWLAGKSPNSMDSMEVLIGIHHLLYPIFIVYLPASHGWLPEGIEVNHGKTQWWSIPTIAYLCYPKPCIPSYGYPKLWFPYIHSGFSKGPRFNVEAAAKNSTTSLGFLLAIRSNYFIGAVI